MVELTKSVITRENDTWVWGKTYSRNSENNPWFEHPGEWMRLKEKLWFTEKAIDIIFKIGITTTSRRSIDLESFFEGDINGWYYVLLSSFDGSDEAIKLILGPIAAYMNENNVSFQTMRHKFPPDYLRCFLEYSSSSKFDKGFSKDIFKEFMITGISFDDDDQRLTGYAVLDSIISNPKYKSVDSSELDSIIDVVIANNLELSLTVKDNPKVIQRFVGLVMKEAKGKATGEVVLNKLKEKLL